MKKKKKNERNPTDTQDLLDVKSTSEDWIQSEAIEKRGKGLFGVLERGRETDNDCSEYRAAKVRGKPHFFPPVWKYDVDDDDGGNGSSRMPTEMCVCVVRVWVCECASSWKGLFILSWLYDGS